MATEHAFSIFQHAQETTARRRAEHEASAAKLDLAVMRQRCAEVISQHEPLAGLGIDRAAAEQLVRFIQTGRLQ